MSSEPSDQFFGEQLAFEVLGVANIEDHCLTIQGELQELRTTIETRRQRRASVTGDATRRPSSQPTQDAATQLASAREAHEQHELRVELVQNYEKRLADMHVQLLTKQQEFETYRHTMEHDLKQQLRHTQPHLVGQLVDKSGAMSVETKTSFLESLSGQLELERLQKENLTFKQTLLKLQTLYDMQREIRDVESEKERALQKSQRLRMAQLVNENTELQQRLRQLDTDLLKVTQERSLVQTKYSELQKQNELAAQRRREAKVRALSAPYRCRLDGIREPGNGDSRDPFDYEQQQEAFEKIHEVRVRSPRQPTATSVDAATREQQQQHFENAARHYQNEIKRLQQQLTNERNSKAQLMDQVTQLKVDAFGSDHDDGDTESPSTSVQKRHVRLSASPRMRAASASVCSPRKVLKVAVMAPRRPSTSFSPRMAPSSGTGPQRDDSQETPAGHAQLTSLTSIPPRSASASAPSTRKFQVQQREPLVVKVGGVAGIQNPLSVRERLPYR